MPMGRNARKLLKRSSHSILASQMTPAATMAPATASTTPSKMNGTRMNQLVAPTSFMTPISLRRA